MSGSRRKIVFRGGTTGVLKGNGKTFREQKYFEVVGSPPLFKGKAPIALWSPEGKSATTKFIDRRTGLVDRRKADLDRKERKEPPFEKERE